ncbi:Integrator complex subunit 9 [Polyrhizophydium stewartii]|uniref:Integrator complex subunit 9 n=1 Tax=Polyrhizophydium stewartii TaxID=2732419 RepID=A0ABR4NCY6_9FUNG
MILQRLGSGGTEWILLETGHESVLVGCGLPTDCKGMPRELRALPWSSIDVILVPTFKDMGALPLVARRTAFRGQVVCSEPTASFGRLWMMEGLRIASAVHLGSGAAMPSLAAYTEADVESAFESVVCVRFGEVKSFGRISVQAHSAGGVLGASAWRIQVGNLKIGFLGDVCLSNGLPKRADLAGFDEMTVVVSSSRIEKRACPSQLHKSLADAWQHAHKTLRANGAVVFASEMGGYVFELVNLLFRLLMSNALDQVSVHVVSSAAKEAFQHARIQGEWMSDALQASLATASEPLGLSVLEAKARLLLHADVESLAKQPCPRVVVTTSAVTTTGVLELLDSVRDHGVPRPLLVRVDGPAHGAVAWKPSVVCAFEPHAAWDEVMLAAKELCLAQLVIARRDIPPEGLDLWSGHMLKRQCTLDSTLIEHGGWDDPGGEGKRLGRISGQLDLGQSRIAVDSSRGTDGRRQALPAQGPEGHEVLGKRLRDEIPDAIVSGGESDIRVDSRSLGRMRISGGHASIQSSHLAGLRTLHRVVATISADGDKQTPTAAS